MNRIKALGCMLAVAFAGAQAPAVPSASASAGEWLVQRGVDRSDQTPGTRYILRGERDPVSADGSVPILVIRCTEGGPFLRVDFGVRLSHPRAAPIGHRIDDGAADGSVWLANIDSASPPEATHRAIIAVLRTARRLTLNVSTGDGPIFVQFDLSRARSVARSIEGCGGAGR